MTRVDAADELADTVEQFLDKPTRKNRDIMEDALGRYRETES